MAVTCSQENGAFLNHHKATEQYYKLVDLQGEKHRDEYLGNSKALQGYRWKADLFAINSPFMMDSQLERMKRDEELANSGNIIRETSAQRKRRKKYLKRPPMSVAQQKVLELTKRALPCLITQAKVAKQLEEGFTLSGQADNNREAREAALLPGCGDLFAELCEQFDEAEDSWTQLSDLMIVSEEQGKSLEAACVVGRCVCNSEDRLSFLQLDDHKFVIPRHCAFLTSSFSYLISHGWKQIQVKDGYDLIVLDPPWSNKSVKRKKSYHMVPEEELKKIPMGDLAIQNCLVCVWTTNNERQRSFVKDELFPHWGVKLVADWIWMKVTRSGEPVCDINSTHKQTYEQLMIGRFQGTQANKQPEPHEETAPETYKLSACILTSLAREEFTLHRGDIVSSTCLPGTVREKPQETDIPQDFVLVSVPCSLHSKKPSLTEVLSKYLPSGGYQSLELFARNLTPGCVSWGLEPLRHQHWEYFEEAGD